MYPILFEFGPITIYSYGLVLFIAVFVSLSLLVKEAVERDYKRDKILDLGITILLSGIIGSRLLYVLLNLDFYLRNPKEIFMLHHGGLAIFGGILVAVIAILVFCRFNKLHFLKIVDLIVPFVALGHSIGRIGCFLNGCCYGMPSKFGIYFPIHNEVLIPTQLISSLLLLILFVILRLKQSRPHQDGAIFVTYIILYSAIRFFVEFIRADSPRFLLGLTIFQYFCIVLFVLGVLSYKIAWKSKVSK